MQNKKSVLISLVVLIALFFGAGIYYKNSKSAEAEANAKEHSALLQRPHSIVIGNKDAKLQLVEFFDPACGTCAYFHPIVKDIMKENKGKIKLVLRYAPFHKNSEHAVKMLIGANEQGLFMDTLEFMFATQKYWIKDHTVNPQVLWRMLPNVKGLDLEKLAAFMNKPDAEKIIEQDLKDVETLKVDKTPSYFVNGKPLIKFGVEPLKDLINSEL